MKYITSLFVMVMVGWWGCGSSQEEHLHNNGEIPTAESHEGHEHAGDNGHDLTIRIAAPSVRQSGISAGKVVAQQFYTTVRVSGELQVPPQNMARVTPYYGANVVRILVMEGDKVHKGQPLAYIEHPDLVRMQAEYLELHSQMAFLKLRYERTKELYDRQIASAEAFQEAKAAYHAARARWNALRSNLRMLNVPLQQLDSGHIIEQLPVRAPINGYIQKVHVNVGQYVEPQTEMFEIIDAHHVHADLMVFEKDIYQVSTGQRVLITIDALQGQTFEGKIFAVGKAFEQKPKALHLHAELDNSHGLLLPGTYVRGQILGSPYPMPALPEEALVNTGRQTYIFQVTRKGDEWTFVPVPIQPLQRLNGWVAIDTTQLPDPTAEYVYTNAYAVYSEWKKDELQGHGH